MIQDLAEQWLLLKQAALVDPEYALFPDFDDALRESMLQETRLVFAEGSPSRSLWLLRAEGVWPDRTVHGPGIAVLRMLPLGLGEFAIPKEKLSGPR